MTLVPPFSRTLPRKIAYERRAMLSFSPSRNLSSVRNDRASGLRPLAALNANGSALVRQNRFTLTQKLLTGASAAGL